MTQTETSARRKPGVKQVADDGRREERIARRAINKGGTASNDSRPLGMGVFSFNLGRVVTLINMNITFHLVPKNYFDSLDPRGDYRPRDFERDGFIHCTDGADEMARVANMFYKANPEAHYYLYIDKTRVRAAIRYEDERHVYPHIYGALNRDAIIAIRTARREADGTFLSPEPLAR